MPSHQENAERLNTKIQKNSFLPAEEKARWAVLTPTLSPDELREAEDFFEQASQEAIGAMISDTVQKAAQSGDEKTMKTLDDFFRKAGKNLRGADEETSQNAEAAEAERILDDAL